MKEPKRARYIRKLRESGLVPLQLWVLPENREAIREYADSLQKTELAIAKLQNLTKPAT